MKGEHENGDDVGKEKEIKERKEQEGLAKKTVTRRDDKGARRRRQSRKEKELREQGTEAGE